jgi:hypothetical protein
MLRVKFCNAAICEKYYETVLSFMKISYRVKRRNNATTFIGQIFTVRNNIFLQILIP